MAKQDLQDDGSFLGDLFRESPFIALGVLLGLLAGGVIGAWMVGVFQDSGVKGVAVHMITLPWLGVTVLCAIVGLLLGVGLDSLVKLVRGRSGAKRRRRRRR
jgi:hypothetical protein